jgi:hypothetical protein
MADYKRDPKMVMALQRALGFIAAKKPLPAALADELGPDVLKGLMAMMSELGKRGLDSAPAPERLEAMRRLMDGGGG